MKYGTIKWRVERIVLQFRDGQVVRSTESNQGEKSIRVHPVHKLRAATGIAKA